MTANTSCFWNAREAILLSHIMIDADILYKPAEANISSTFAPKLVAISMGWMAREKRMSEVAKAMINTDVEESLVGLSKSTEITDMFRTHVSITKKNKFNFYRYFFKGRTHTDD